MIQLYDQGEPVRDVAAWAKARGSTLVRVEETRRVLDPTTATSYETTLDLGWMPRICLDYMRYTDDVRHRIIEERQP